MSVPSCCWGRTNRQDWVRSNWRAQFDYSFIDQCLSKSSIIRIVLAYGFDKITCQVFIVGQQIGTADKFQCADKATQRSKAPKSARTNRKLLFVRDINVSWHNRHTQRTSTMRGSYCYCLEVMTHSKNKVGSNKTNKICNQNNWNKRNLKLRAAFDKAKHLSLSPNRSAVIELLCIQRNDPPRALTISASNCKAIWAPCLGMDIEWWGRKE